MSLGHKAKREANLELLKVHNGYQQLLREGHIFQLATEQNHGILPASLVDRYRKWRYALREVDAVAQRIYR